MTIIVVGEMEPWKEKKGLDNTGRSGRQSIVQGKGGQRIGKLQVTVVIKDLWA